MGTRKAKCRNDKAESESESRHLERRHFRIVNNLGFRVPTSKPRTNGEDGNVMAGELTIHDYVGGLWNPSEIIPAPGFYRCHEVCCRLWRSVEIGAPSDCWPFTGGTSAGGYGRIKAGKKLVSAHRLAYALTHGLDVHGLPLIRHTCDNPKCCNPRHLLVGTKLDNYRDMVERGRAWWQKKQPA
jgi:hypothetical protein